IGQRPVSAVDRLALEGDGLGPVLLRIPDDLATAGDVAAVVTRPRLLGERAILRRRAAGEGEHPDEGGGEDPPTRGGPHAPATLLASGRRAFAGSLYSTPTMPPAASKRIVVTDARVHSRLRGSCHRRRPSAASRVVQMGSWWLTMTASWPSARSRASSTAGIIRSRMCV